VASGEQWRRYAPIEVLKYFPFSSAAGAETVWTRSRNVDEYLAALREWNGADENARELRGAVSWLEKPAPVIALGRFIRAVPIRAAPRDIHDVLRIASRNSFRRPPRIEN